MSTLSETILKSAAAKAEGHALTAKELLHLGSRAAVDQTLSRLTRSKALARIGRGLYVLPVQTRFGARLPSAELVVQALAKSLNEQVSPGTAATANGLGLTTQVPVRTVYLTSGRTRRLKFGAHHLELRHAPSLQVQEGPVGSVTRALAWSGKARASGTLAQLKGRFSAHERELVVKSRATMPTWMAQAVSVWVSG